MSRAAVPGLPSRHPIGGLLPALYAEDDLAQRFTAGLDTVLAPVFATLDNLPAYFDPRLAPWDFLVWVASWVGVRTDPGRPAGPSRAAVARAVESHRWRGTRRGLRAQLRLVLGVDAQIVDGGGVSWSSTAGSPLPAPPATEVLVRVWSVDATVPVDVARVRAVVEAACPVHLTCRVEVVSGPPGERED
ncbi:phage tail protein [Wenjunlia vitaminophila]|uniref:Phage tail protein n=1 Tax=Wenjunlia vitaminophila TaxID=76728 RepID=A0A0T6LWT8_WENVI|nr:phage tail protein [Wenjunlia vitaminophila]KRV50188.1 phage tail protein [Wenjunlia vitaminophila]